MPKIRKKEEKREKRRKRREKREKKKEEKREVFVELHGPDYKQARGARRAEGAARSEKSM